MSWTYTHGTSDIDRVRRWIGDTDQTKPWTLQDEDINALLADAPSNLLLGAAYCAEAILANFKGAIVNSNTVGDLSISTDSTSITFFETNAYRLKQRANLAAVKPYLGGYSKNEKRGQDSIEDRQQPAFKVDGMSMTGQPINDATKGP